MLRPRGQSSLVVHSNGQCHRSAKNARCPATCYAMSPKKRSSGSGTPVRMSRGNTSRTTATPIASAQPQLSYKTRRSPAKPRSHPAERTAGCRVSERRQDAKDASRSAFSRSSASAATRASRPRPPPASRATPAAPSQRRAEHRRGERHHERARRHFSPPGGGLVSCGRAHGLSPDCIGVDLDTGFGHQRL